MAYTRLAIPSPWLRALAAACLAAACVGGCATFRSYDAELRDTLTQVSSGDVGRAIKVLQSNNKRAKKDLLYYLELGELERLQESYANSQTAWMSADQRVHAWEQTARSDPAKLLGGAASLLLNDKQRPYEGHDYEKVMLTTRIALNYLSMGDYDRARVAIKQTHEREAVIANLRAKELDEVERDAQERGARTSFKELNGYPVQSIDNPEVNALKNSYQSALSHYLAGFIYEAQGEPSLAAAGYRQAIELQPNQPLLEDALRGLDQRVSEPTGGLTDVLFVVESGTAPARQSREFPLPIPVTHTLILIPISFPVMESTGSAYSPAQLTADGSETLPLVPITSIDLMARRALKDEMRGLMLRATIRSSAKAVAQYQLQRQAHQTDNLLLGVAAIALTLGSVVTESADERTWRTLPSQIAIARTKLPPGKHTIALPTGYGERTIDVSIAGHYAVVGLRLLHGRVFVQPVDAPSPPAGQSASTSNGVSTLEEHTSPENRK